VEAHSGSDVLVEADGRHLPGLMSRPPEAAGIVVFAHGSGSSRLSPRNLLVARALEAEGLATLLFDLLDEDEALDRANVFDIELLARRLAGATVWVRERLDLPVGYFGASTGAAAALVAAAGLGEKVAAVVSRGGRPDLAGELLGAVRAPTLLIVGGADDVVLALNREAASAMRCPVAMRIVPGATHLFEEPGALEQVVDLAAGWYRIHLRR
jgi:putative phosphoribosyl transferase